MCGEEREEERCRHGRSTVGDASLSSPFLRWPLSSDSGGRDCASMWVTTVSLSAFIFFIIFYFFGFRFRGLNFRACVLFLFSETFNTYIQYIFNKKIS